MRSANDLEAKTVQPKKSIQWDETFHHQNQNPPPFELYGRANVQPANSERYMYTHNVKSPRKVHQGHDFDSMDDSQVYPEALATDVVRKSNLESSRALRDAQIWSTAHTGTILS